MDKKLQHRLLFDAVDHIYTNINDSIKLSWALPITFLVITWNDFEHWQVIITMSLFLLVSLIRKVIISQYEKDKDAYIAIESWEKRMMLITGFSGLVLGFVSWYFYPQNDPELQIFFYIMMFSVVAGAVPIYGHYEPMFLLTLVPIYLGLSINLLMQATLESLGGLAVLTVFFLVMRNTSRANGQLFNQYATVQYNNRRLIRSLKEEKDKTIKAVQDKARFISSASHDIRQPVHSLSLFIDALEQRVNRQPELLELLQNMRKSLRVLGNFLMGILDISKLDSGTIKATPVLVKVRPFLHTIKDSFVPIAEEKQLELRVRVTIEEACFDTVLLTTVLSNLLKNAIKFSKKNKKILLTAKKVNNTLCFQVIDQGVGIRQEHQQRIFDEFEQVDNEARHHKEGLGLGLSISQRMVKLAGGKIEVKSQPGKGSCFRVVLPLKAEKNKKMPSAIEPLLSDSCLHHKHILLVDDEKMVLDAMSKVLLKWGCKVTVADDYTQAVSNLNGVKPDIVIADYRLKNRNGLELIERLREDFSSNIPAMIITGDTSAEKLQLFQEKQVRILHKPVQAAGLKVALNALLS